MKSFSSTLSARFIVLELQYFVNKFALLAAAVAMSVVVCDNALKSADALFAQLLLAVLALGQQALRRRGLLVRSVLRQVLGDGTSPVVRGRLQLQHSIDELGLLAAAIASAAVITEDTLQRTDSLAP